MIYGDSKRIVVVRGIPSNFVEEAILILKHQPEKDSSSKPNSSTSKKDGVKVNTDYLLKEAETIINSYIVENKLNDKYHKKVNPKKRLLINNKKLINVILNTGIVLSIGLLIFVVSRLF